MKIKKINSILAFALTVCLIISSMICLTAFNVSAEETDYLSIFNEYVAEVGNNFSQATLLARFKDVDSDATINECFIKHAVDGVSIKGNNRSDWDSEMIAPGNDGYVAINATVGGTTISGVARIPRTDETITGEVAYYTGASHADFTVTNGVVTDYTGTAKILVFANETVSVDFSSATCKNQIEAIYFRTANANTRILTVKAHSFENFTALKAVFFQEKQYFVYGNIETYAFANNANLKYVKLMDTLYQGGIQDYAFYNCPSLQLVRGGYLRIKAIQFGYGAFAKTGVRDYILGNDVKYNTGANQGNVFGFEHTCLGDVTYLVLNASTKTLTATQMAVYAQAASDNYTGTISSNDVKTALVASYSDFGTANSADFDSFTTSGTETKGTFVITKNDVSVNVMFYRNNAQALIGLSCGYTLTPAFSQDTTSYSIRVADSVTNINVNCNLAYGANLVSITGNTGLTAGQTGTITVVVKDANGTNHTYTISVLRDKKNSENTQNAISLIKSYVLKVENDFSRTELLNKLQSLDANATINECFIRHAVDGVKVITGNNSYDNEMINTGNDGYVAVNATVNGETFGTVAFIPHKEEIITGTYDVCHPVTKASSGNFTFDDNGVVTDYTGTANIIIIENDVGTSKINFSDATCKDKIDAILIRTCNGNTRILDVQANSFENFSNLKAVFFKDLQAYGSINQYAFANNPKLKYVYLNPTIDYIQDYAFYNCPSLENCKNVYGRLANAQYGYGAFAKTGIRDYYLNSSTRYNNGANQGNVFGQEPTCKGDVNVLTFAEARTNISATQMATLAQAAADTYSGNLTADAVKTTLVASYSDFGTATSVDWVRTFKTTADSANGVLEINKNGISVDVEFYKNDNEAIRDIYTGYDLTPKFSADITDYTLDLPYEKTNVNIGVRLVNGASLVSISGNDNIEIGQDGEITVVAKDAKNVNHTYTIDVKHDLVKLDMVSGTTLREDTPTGIRFAARVYGADDIGNINTVSKVSYGMLIVPTDYLTGIEFTEANLLKAKKDYLSIPQKYWADEDSSYKEMRIVISDIKDENLNREFSARAFADIVFTDGSSKRIYSDFDKNDNTGSINYLAGEILCDSNSVLTDARLNTLSSMVVGAATTQASLKKTEILNSTDGAYKNIDNEIYSGTTYYVSPNGNDSNSGTNTSEPWKSISKISSVPSGSKVLFERGGTYRGYFNAKSNVYYGAYGSGAKPVICGSYTNYANENWSLLGDSNPNVLWVNVKNAFGEEKHSKDFDAGIIVCDGGKLVGEKKEQLSDLTNYGDFYYNYQNGRLYLNSNGNNPKNLFNDIEIGINNHLITIYDDATNVTIENLALRYTGAHGISARDGVSGIKIANCEISYVGGSYSDGETLDTFGNIQRYGNGVEFWNGCEKVLVDNCYIHDIYDSGLSHQGTISRGVVFEVTNLTFSNNLVEKCGLDGIEYWVSNGTDKNGTPNRFNGIAYTDNIIRLIGFGWGSWKNTRTAGYGIATGLNKNIIKSDSTFIMSGNIIDCCRMGLINIVTSQWNNLPTLTNNTFYQYEGVAFGSNGYSGNESEPVKTYYANNTDYSDIITYRAGENGSLSIIKR